MANAGVLCRYFFQAMLVDEDAPPEDYASSLLLSPQPTLAELRRAFPFVGKYHFRLQLATKDGSYCWLDLTDDKRVLPVTRGEIRVKVLQVSAEADESEEEGPEWVDIPEDRLYDAYFQTHYPANGRRVDNNNYNGGGSSGLSSTQDVGAVLSGVKKALASKMKQSGLGQTLQKQSAKMWDKVTGGVAGSSNSPPTAAALSQLAKLVGAMKAPLSEANREHMELLSRLWQSCFEPQPFAPRGQAWAQLGFRREDPLQELQCLLPLQCLVFFHEVHRNVALPMLNEQAIPNHPDTYAYGLVASRIAYVVADILQLKDGACLGLERPFWRLFEDPIAFFELFSITFRAFDQSWKTRSGKSAEVGFHLDFAADFAQEVLRRGPESVPVLVDYAHQMLKW
ncbi:hypothetical protein Poli38472_008413 [Pythium oligandrum]|uniref:ELMO domain-containing protein n=1 Tax=Pythium oligandrum TaxID=41045 RepID=A0A8K1CNB3_PYTOL|nr:hypothetical protein Poli38472_008413 [Pythium oligandrum]|eukprot:TMW65771.1 hypothetical protein Poli38472_008413 [Pythium oligandrum]